MIIPPSYLNIGMGGYFDRCRKADAQKFSADVYGCPTNLEKYLQAALRWPTVSEINANGIKCDTSVTRSWAF